MGRKRAAFPEGIAEEEQRYAQVLRDIRDLRGETQQALGQLLGWSVSMVSRFEAAAERPDQATHRCYCALAPTEELRERAMAAYEALPAPPERHAAPIRRSPEEWHGRALDGPGLYQFFAAAYPDLVDDHQLRGGLDARGQDGWRHPGLTPARARTAARR
jgi:hypothetical protein